MQMDASLPTTLRDQIVSATKRAHHKAGIANRFPHITHSFKEAVPMAPSRETRL